MLKFFKVGNPIESFSGIEALPTPIDIGSLYKDELSKETLGRILGYFRKHGIKHEWVHPNWDTDEYLTEEELRIRLAFYKTQPPEGDAFYKINEYISLELDRDEVHLYVDGEDFRQCIALFIPDPQTKPTQELIDSIDEAEEMLIDPSERDISAITLGITSKQEFWAYCSNLQVWAENHYDTRILHRNLAFPLLKKLTEAGDPMAKKVFREEIAKRYASGCHSVVEFLRREGYLNYLEVKN